MKTYFLKKGTSVFETDTEITLRRGVIHKNELAINKDKSSKEFILYFGKVIKDKRIKIDVDNDVYADFETLSKFGFLACSNDLKKESLIIVDDHLLEIFNAVFKTHYILPASKFLSETELDILIDDKNILKLNQVKTEKKIYLEKYGMIFLISQISKLSYLRGFNKLMKLTKQINSMMFFDNENIFISTIKHDETGCYECLEQQIMTHFKGFADDYLIDIKGAVSSAEMLFALSILKKELENINTYGESSLLGNLIHFNLANYEYSFNTNRIQSNCTTCATFNNILFEEQNIRSINVLKELMTND